MQRAKLENLAVQLVETRFANESAAGMPPARPGSDVGRVFEVRRFTHYEHECGETDGWRVYSAWYRRMSGLEWAWFRREVEDGEAHPL